MLQSIASAVIGGVLATVLVFSGTSALTSSSSSTTNNQGADPVAYGDE